MDNQVLNLTYASSLTELCEVNSSFDSGVLKIAYTGQNRNGSYISKEAFERCMATIYNCPIVCNYNRETDSLGGHDMEVVASADGELRLVNLTTPVGCIPESAKVFWETVEEDDGTKHEYLCAEALLWKRQEAYKKIKTNGITAQSMEITVKEGMTIDDVYHIENFEFTAFALLGVEPCFESASLEMFSKQNFKQQLSEMMLELKESFTLVNPLNRDGDIQHNLTEGGEQVLDRNELVEKYGIDVNTLDFSIEDFSVEELEEKFKAMVAEPTDDNDESKDDNFALMSNIVEEIRRSLEEVKVQRDWGECVRYWFVDCDIEIKEVYCWDLIDWLLYGFTYEMNGDNVIIDFENKKRKKYIIADFEEGEQESPFATTFAQMEQTIKDNAGWEAKYQSASDTIASMETELDELRSFKAETEAAALEAQRDNIFAQFEDLNGEETFETLRENCSEYDLATIEEKCYAIRGRQQKVATVFSTEPKTPKIQIDRNTEDTDEPYSGMFVKYGFKPE